MKLRLEAEVRTPDGLAGTLADVVLDPASRSVTHVVVRAGDPEPAARLVPLGLVEERAGETALTCSAQELEQLPAIQGYAYLPVDERPVPDSQWDVGVEDVVVMPTYQSADLGVYTSEIEPNVGVTYDRVPKGEVEIRRTSPVESSDGHEVGTVHAFTVEGAAITHVLVEHGHLWRHRITAVPIASITTLATNALTLGMRKAEFRELPDEPG